MSDKIVEYILISIGGIVGFFLGIWVGISTDSTFLGFVVMILAIAAIMAMGKFLINKKREKRGKEQINHYTFNKEDGTMTLLQRSKISCAAVHWDPLYEHDLKYHPSKTIYTGASSGGVAMGGFHTTEAYYQERPTKRSGRYIAFIQFYNGERLYIKEIILTDKVLEEAKNDPKIRKFLKRDRLVLLNRKPKADLDGLTPTEVLNGGTVIQHAYTDRQRANVGITLADATLINEWLKG